MAAGNWLLVAGSRRANSNPQSIELFRRLIGTMYFVFHPVGSLYLLFVGDNISEDDPVEDVPRTVRAESVSHGSHFPLGVQQLGGEH
jgi:hypothetical protein